MNRRTLFAGIAGAGLVVALCAGAGIAYAVVKGQLPPDDSGPAVAASAEPIATPSPATPTTPGAAPQPGSLPIAERLRPWRAGDRLVTEQELRDLHATLPTANAAPASYELLMKTNLYAMNCMKDAGFYWDPRLDFRLRPDANLNHADPAARIALYGEPQGDTYDWRKGGCDGVGAHLAGADGGPGVPGTVFPGYTPPAG